MLIKKENLEKDLVERLELLDADCFNLFSAKQKNSAHTPQIWFHIWMHENQQIDNICLEKNATLVASYLGNIIIVSPKEFNDEYEFTNIHPYKGTTVKKGSYKKNLLKMKKTIRRNLK